MIGALAGCFLPLACGLWMLRAGGAGAARGNARLGRVALLALVAADLSPFLVWWSVAPTRIYFAANGGAR